jgi:hypothetical protein
MWLPVQSTNLSRAAQHYAQSHSFPVIPCCIDKAKALRRDAFRAMIRRLLSLPPIAVKATARAFPGAQCDEEEGSDDGSRGAVAAACENVETDAVGTCRAAVRPKNPPTH